MSPHRGIIEYCTIDCVAGISRSLNSRKGGGPFRAKYPSSADERVQMSMCSSRGQPHEKHYIDLTKGTVVSAQVSTLTTYPASAGGSQNPISCTQDYENHDVTKKKQCLFNALKCLLERVATAKQRTCGGSPVPHRFHTLGAAEDPGLKQAQLFWSGVITELANMASECGHFTNKNNLS